MEKESTEFLVVGVLVDGKGLEMLLHPKGKYEIAIEAELVSVRYGIFGGWRLSGRGRPLAVACHQARKEHSIKPNQLGGGGAKYMWNMKIQMQIQIKIKYKYNDSGLPLGKERAHI